jgi:hypothetical protein
MKHEREFDTNYFHNPHVQGVNYSLFIMLVKEMVLMTSKGQSGAAPLASPLLSSQSSDLYYVFCVSLPPHHETTKGRVYIVAIRSRRVRGVQDCVKTMLGAKGGAHHVARVVACMVGPLSYLVASLVDIFFSRSSISRRNDVVNFLGPFDV